jgi:hypothetical protein
VGPRAARVGVVGARATAAESGLGWRRMEEPWSGLARVHLQLQRLWSRTSPVPLPPQRSMQVVVVVVVVVVAPRRGTQMTACWVFSLHPPLCNEIGVSTYQVPGYPNLNVCGCRGPAILAWPAPLPSCFAVGTMLRGLCV